MAASRTTFEKLQRDRAKKAKAEAKRAKRLGQAPEGLHTGEAPEVEETASTDFGVDEELSAGDLLLMVETLQAQFDRKEIDFDEYEERKIELFTRLPVD
ncbi:MAG: hypothetical protein ACI8Y4_000953 [Candidatus Poriferisodalaceae bacterium]|jgi:hypothetical protein